MEPCRTTPATNADRSVWGELGGSVTVAPAVHSFLSAAHWPWAAASKEGKSNAYFQISFGRMARGCR